MRLLSIGSRKPLTHAMFDCRELQWQVYSWLYKEKKAKMWFFKFILLKKVVYKFVFNFRGKSSAYFLINSKREKGTIFVCFKQHFTEDIWKNWQNLHVRFHVHGGKFNNERLLKCCDASTCKAKWCPIAKSFFILHLWVLKTVFRVFFADCRILKISQLLLKQVSLITVNFIFSNELN